MNMYDNIPDPEYFSAEESPIPVPSAEESWSLMQKKLDDARPAPVIWWWPLKGFIFAGAVVVPVLGWLALHLFSVEEHRPIHRYTTMADRIAAHSQAGRPGVSRVNPRVNPPVNLQANPADSATSPTSGAPTGSHPTGGAPVTSTGASATPTAGAAAAGAANPTGGHPTAGHPTDFAPQQITYVPSTGIPAFRHPFPGGLETAMNISPNQVNIMADSSNPAGKPVKSGKPAKSGKSGKPRDSRTHLLIAAGFSLIQNAPLGDQLIYVYNINGKSNLLSDYVPAPYLQYFLRRNLYLQVAFQFNSPQYTPSLVIDSPRTEPKVNLTVFTTSTLQKLYYSNIPVTIDYSPFAHLFLGTGLQYSGLRGGFVYQRVVSYDSASILPITYRTATLTKTMEQNFQLRKTDWRILFEANYYWKRTTLGLRYQQPLSSFSRNGAAGASGMDKNESLGFYLQYNLWERKRKN
jgi:hypothetical protein